LGNAAIVDGLGRLLAVMLIVGVLHHHAAGAMTAVLLGLMAVLVLTGWFVRDCLRGEAPPMQWAAWLKRVVPLTLGLGVAQFMLAADMIFVQKFFSKEQTGFYAAAGTVGRSLVYFTLPVAGVMFPKLARSRATGEKSNALALALGITALAGLGAALMCTLFPALPVRILLNKSYQEISAPLVPWFAWGMLPLTLATVLINSLMAQARFAAVPWLVAVAGGYALTLYLRLGALANPTDKQFPIVVQTLGMFSLLLLAICAWFTWGAKSKAETQV
jgi:O-antigen/teichoic acid export membrane protein